MVILSSPSNPTGGVIPPDEYERILAACKKHNVWLMGDECYSHFTYDAAQAVFHRQRGRIRKNTSSSSARCRRHSP